jgi:hypothetical protein
MPPVQINKEACEGIIAKARCEECDIGFKPVEDEGVPGSEGSTEGSPAKQLAAAVMEREYSTHNYLKSLQN